MSHYSNPELFLPLEMALGRAQEELKEHGGHREKLRVQRAFDALETVRGAFSGDTLSMSDDKWRHAKDLLLAIVDQHGTPSALHMASFVRFLLAHRVA